MTGCGYAAGKNVQVMVDMPESMAFTSVGAGANGCWTLKLWTGNTPGKYGIRTYQQLRGGSKLTLMATASLSVV